RQFGLERSPSGIPILNACWRNAPMVLSISREISLIGVPFLECSWSRLRLCVVQDFRIIFLIFLVMKAAPSNSDDLSRLRISVQQHPSQKLHKPPPRLGGAKQ